MKLERKNPVYSIIIKRFPNWRCCLILLVLLSALPDPARSQKSRKPELIRDTDIAEGKENPEAAEVEKPEPDPVLAKENLNIGNFYFKRKNFAAAIQRYSDALAYNPDWKEANEALDRAICSYEAEIRNLEKNGDIIEAIIKCKDFIRRYPDSPKLADFRNMLSELENKSD
jgi:tetratricopeptide (TPR) repeat protein